LAVFNFAEVGFRARYLSSTISQKSLPLQPNFGIQDDRNPSMAADPRKPRLDASAIVIAALIAVAVILFFWFLHSLAVPTAKPPSQPLLVPKQRNEGQESAISGTLSDANKADLRRRIPCPIIECERRPMF
jgi:hypothetical protein